MSDNKLNTVNLTNNKPALAALIRFRELKAIEKAGEAAKKERTESVEPILYAALGGADAAIVRGLTAFKVVGSSTSKIDRELLAVKFPGAVEACTVSTPYTYIKTI